MRFRPVSTATSRLPKLLGLALALVCAHVQGQSMLPEGFVRLSEACPTMIISANYATAENFTGSVVDGYRRREAILSKIGAEALCRVNSEARAQGLLVKVYDSYRPVKAVSFFQAWARLPEGNPEIKARYYPHFTRQELFEHGYIAQRSSHSRGSAVDLTLTKADGTEMDMGTIFDFFHERSHTAHRGITREQRRNRELLKGMMERHGFKNFAQEWWHYSLVQEAFPGQSFDFDVD